MQLVRRQETWGPFREMEDRMSRFFGPTRWPGNLLSRWPSTERELLATTDWSPSCDISETDKEYRIHAELPSVQKDDVHVTLDAGVLTIQGERREQKEEEGMKFNRRELCYGNFLRRFTMPNDADESKIDATFKDGMLNIVIGRSKPQAAKTKDIAIH